MWSFTGCLDASAPQKLRISLTLLTPLRFSRGRILTPGDPPSLLLLLLTASLLSQTSGDAQNKRQHNRAAFKINPNRLLKDNN